MNIGILDNMYVNKFMRVYIIDNLLATLIRKNNQIDSTGLQPDKIKDRLFEIEFGYIPNALLEECFILNQLEDKNEFDDASEDLYKKLIEYVKMGSIYESAREEALWSLAKKKGIYGYDDILFRLDRIANETNDNFTLRNRVPLINSSKNMEEIEMPVRNKSSIADRLNFMGQLDDDYDCQIIEKITTADERIKIAEELYNYEVNSFRFYRYNDCILMIQSPDKYVMLKTVALDFDEPWLIEQNRDGIEEIRHVSIDKYNHVFWN